MTRDVNLNGEVFGGIEFLYFDAQSGVENIAALRAESEVLGRTCKANMIMDLTHGGKLSLDVERREVVHSRAGFRLV